MPNETAFDSEAGFREALDAVIASATQEIRVFDPGLKRVMLEQKDRADALDAFLAGDRDRRLRIVMHDTDHCERQCPRLLALQRRFSLAVEFRQTPDNLRGLAECHVLADRRHAALRFHVDQPRGKLIVDNSDEVHPWWQRFGDLWTLSTPCLSATRLGL